jgi:linoleoyl-CoA desaturase
VRELFDRFGLRYHTAPMPQQVGSAWHKVLRLSLPNGWLARTTWSTTPRRVTELLRTTASRSDAVDAAA